MATKTIDDVLVERATAGAAYAAAATAFVDAWVQLAAYDVTVRNRRLGLNEEFDKFNGPPPISEIQLHAEFLPVFDCGNVGERVRILHEQLLADLA